ncbi:MAG TPA: SPOR domain-containing protein, partial [Candidatus Binatus sp.]|nr:SPOR domain-containing protein [Candidatus Binatus sp.]
PAVPIPVPPAKTSASERPADIAKPTELPTIAKSETPAAAVQSAPITAQTTPEKTSREKPAGEQLALLREKAGEIAPVKPAVARPAPKALEGFIIQLAFSDKEKAQRWAESMEKRGYAVSLTEAGTEGSLRVRLGNFAVRDDAERQLRNFKQDGLSGIIINLPQSFRPEARTSIP